MKKTLIALALTALPVASMADVILYGQVKAGVEVTKTKGVAGTSTQIVDYGSRIGFKGHEHLNGDLNAIWQVETAFDVAGSTQTKLGGRDSFIGLQSKSFGTVKAGNLSTPVKVANGALDIWENNDSLSHGAAGLDIFTRSNEAVARKLAISYTTPEFSGVTATAYVSPSENAGEDSENRSKKDTATYGLGFNYKNAGIFADLAAVAVRGSTQATAAGKSFGYQGVAQVGYEADNYTVGLAYQQARNVEKADGAFQSLDGAVTRAQEVAATGTYNATDALRLKATVAYGFNLENEAGAKQYGNGKYQQAIIGADYALSKRTQVNAQVGHLRVGKGEERFAETAGTVGLAHKF